MNKSLSFLFCTFFVLLGASNPGDKRLSKRNFREVVSVYTDAQDPEKSYKKVEKLDRQGNVVESWEWNLNGVLNQRIQYTNSPRLEKKMIYSGNDSLLLVEFTEFDERGRKIHYSLHDKRKNRSEDVVIEYNKWGEKSYEKSKKNGKITQVKSYEYNELGLVTAQITSDSAGVVYSKRTYQYNK